MKLIDLLAPGRVVVPLAGRTLRQVGEELISALAASGVTAEPERLKPLLAAAVPGDVLAVGSQAMMLHLRTDAVSGLALALGVAPRPVRRLQRDSSKDARIVALIVAPLAQATNYLRATGAVARALSQPDIVAGMLAAKSTDEVFAIEPLAEIELLDYLTVRDVMDTRVVSVGPGVTLGEAAKLMVIHDVPALPVVGENGEVLGMVGHREVLRYLVPAHTKRVSGEYRLGRGARAPSATATPEETPVRDAMDRSVLCLSSDQSLGDVASLMGSKDVDRFPVVADGRLIGLLTRRAIVRRMFGP